MNVNSGLHEQNSTPLEAQRTCIVLGRTRGGTTMVSRALSTLEVPMGHNLRPGNNEDPTLSKLVRGDDPASIQRYIDQRNAAEDVWGVKSPLLFKFRKELQFRNPRFIFVMRDAIAPSLRFASVHEGDPVPVMRATLKLYLANLDYIEKSARPTLFVSYEKAVGDPHGFCTRLCAFVGGNSSRIPEATATIIPNNPQYGVE